MELQQGRTDSTSNDATALLDTLLMYKNKASAIPSLQQQQQSQQPSTAQSQKKEAEQSVGDGEDVDEKECLIQTCPPEVIEHIFRFCPPDALLQCRQVCNLWSTVIDSGNVWRTKCEELIANVPNTLVSTAEKHKFRCSLWQLLFAAFKKPYSGSLIKQAYYASSQDRPVESIDETLYNSKRTGYWSSSGSSDEDSSEFLAYKLKSSVTIIKSFILAPFLATFQLGNPCYAPKRVRFHISARKTFWKGSCWTSMEDDQNEFTYSSPAFNMQNTDDEQVFAIPPTMMLGKCFVVELIGRTTKQRADDQWYTCIRYAGVKGIPLLNFDFGESGSGCQLRYEHKGTGVQPLAFIDEVGEEAAERVTLTLKYAYNDLLNEYGILLAGGQNGGGGDGDEYEEDDEDDEYPDDDED